MKKVYCLMMAVIGLMIVFFLTGCSVDSISSKEYSSDDMGYQNFYVYVDKKTCVEYFVSDGYYNYGTVTPRYNQDGTLKLNEECLEDLGEEND